MCGLVRLDSRLRGKYCVLQWSHRCCLPAPNECSPSSDGERTWKPLPLHDFSLCGTYFHSVHFSFEMIIFVSQHSWDRFYLSKSLFSLVTPYQISHVCIFPSKHPRKQSNKQQFAYISAFLLSSPYIFHEALHNSLTFVITYFATLFQHI